MRALLILLFLAACGASPSPEFFHAQRFEARRAGHDYVVFKKENQVQVIRLGFAHRKEHVLIRANMAIVVEELTGCRLTDPLVGDSGAAKGRVLC